MEHCLYRDILATLNVALVHGSRTLRFVVGPRKLLNVRYVMFGFRRSMDGGSR